jgi:hypothetical protein
MAERDRFFKLFLRVIGTAALFALVAVVMPYSWMNAIHPRLGMGTLPSEPIVGYLARSTSAFYALLGALLWVVSFDLVRHRLILRFLGVAIIVFGGILLIVDFVEGMPLWWSLWEGPINMAFGTIILILSNRLAREIRRRR